MLMEWANTRFKEHGVGFPFSWLISSYIFRLKKMGRVKPTTGLVVAPTIVIASPIFGIITAHKQVIATRTKVHKKFSF